MSRNAINSFRNSPKTWIYRVPGYYSRRDLNTDNVWYPYTSTRLPSNGKQRPPIQHVKFDMDRLIKSATRALGLLPKNCIKVEKFYDAKFSRTFLFTMDNNREVLAKIPHPDAGLPYYTTASEVATLKLARGVLEAPVPKVLAWSSDAASTPIGSEYIVMTKPLGIPVSNYWSSMDSEQRSALVKSICLMQKSWTSKPLYGFGSVYHMSNLENSYRRIELKNPRINAKTPIDSSLTDKDWVVGPSTGRGFLDDGRIDMEIDRGPFGGVRMFKKGAALREIACVQSVPQLPPSPPGTFGPSTYHPSRTKKIAALQNYIRILPYLLPTDKSLNAPCLWNPNILNLDNIFVKHREPTEIVSIMDWQSSEVIPLFDHARRLTLLDRNGPPTTTEVPELPLGFNQFGAMQQANTWDLYLKLSLAALYRRATLESNEPLARAMEMSTSTAFKIMDRAENMLVESEALAQLSYLDLRSEWDQLPAVRAAGNPPFPLSFSEEEIEEIRKDAAAANGARSAQKLGEELGSLLDLSEGGKRVDDEEESFDEAWKEGKIDNRSPDFGTGGRRRAGRQKSLERTLRRLQTLRPRQM
ncbi:hypothetical protein BDV18DRAFT_146832 [Aspergillus unguis]